MRIFGKTVGAGAVLVSVLALGVSPATASDVSPLGLSECRQGYVCLWDMVNYQRLLVEIPGYAVVCPNGAALGPGAIDMANSMANKTNHDHVRFYTYQGASHPSDPWKWLWTLDADESHSFNNQPERKDRIDMVTTCDLG